MDLSKREKVLLQLLLTQKEFRPAAFFQEQLYVSLKTVYTDLASLEEKIKPYGLTIARLPRRGVKLEGNPTAREKATNSSLLKVKSLTNILLNIVNCLSLQIISSRKSQCITKDLQNISTLVISRSKKM